MSTSASRSNVPTSTGPAPQPTHPVAGRAVGDEAPEFQWMPVPETETYHLQVAATEAFDTLYYDETVDGPTTIDLESVLPSDATTAVWRVRAGTPASAPWSVAATFAVTEQTHNGTAEFVVDAPPVPIRPIAGDAVEANGATLTWEGVPEASGYRVQVAATDDFENPVADLPLDQVTSLTLFETLPEGAATLYWRVRALFENETEGPWSEIGRFGTDPDMEDEYESQRDTGDGETSVKRSPVMAGPGSQARTSGGMAVAFIGILVISFLLTILAIMMSGG